MRSDSDIKRDVEDELRWDPDIDSTDIAVTVKNGVVTLAGFTRSYSNKLEAEAAANGWLASWDWQTTLRCAYRTLTSGRIPKSPAMRSPRSRTDYRSSPSSSRCWFAMDGSPSKARSSGTFSV